MKRVLTALLLLPLVAAVIFFAPGAAVWVVLGLVALLCLREFFEIAEKLNLRPFRILGYGAGALLVLARDLPQPAFFVAVSAVLLILSLQPGHALSDSFGAVASTLLGMVYVCGPFALARELYSYHPHWLFWVLALTWVGDAAAYYVGRAWGQRPLAPRISGEKTWEGTLASALSAVAVGAGYLIYFRSAEVSWAQAVLLCVAVNVAAQLGDLAESALKRAAKMKDSGSLLPGHGGMLDRLDGVLFSVPAAYLCLSWML